MKIPPNRKDEVQHIHTFVADLFPLQRLKVVGHELPFIDNNEKASVKDFFMPG